MGGSLFLWREGFVRVDFVALGWRNF